MKLQQLRFVLEVARNGLNVSAAAARLYTSQPAVSKQLRALEDELGVPLFQRRGKQFVGLTTAGQEIVALAEEVLRRAESIRRVAQDHGGPQRGELGIVTTPELARGRLVPIIPAFRARYPLVRVRLTLGPPAQLAALSAQEGVDLVVHPQPGPGTEGLVLLPCAPWAWAALCLPGAVPGPAPLTLAALAQCPLLGSPEAFAPDGTLTQAFAQAGLRAEVILTAADGAAVRAAVRAGLGIGLLPDYAWAAPQDEDLACVALAGPAGGVVHIGFRRELRLRAAAQDFITLYAPHLTRSLIVEAHALRDPAAVAALVATSAPAALI